MQTLISDRTWKTDRKCSIRSLWKTLLSVAVGAFFAVYDGHGGRDVMEYCESTLHDIVLQELRNLSAKSELEEDVGKALVVAFQKVDSQVAMLGVSKVGCTATVALVHRQGTARTLYVANVGDSRAVALGRAGLQRLSRDHKASDPAEQARIADEGGLVSRGRVGGVLCVSRSLGDHHLKDCGVSCVPDVTSTCCEEVRVVVMASDGLWDVLEDAEVDRFVADCVDRSAAQHGNWQEVAAHLRKSVAAELVEEAKARGSRDNILVLVIFF